MNKKINILFMLLMMVHLFSFDLEHLVHFNIGSGIDELMYNKDVDPGNKKGPNGITIGEDGLLYIADTWNGRILELDYNFQVKREITVEFGSEDLTCWNFYFMDGHFFSQYALHNYSIVDISGTRILHYDFLFTDLYTEMQKIPVVYEGNFFQITDDEDIFFIPKPESDIERSDHTRMIWNDAVYDLIKNNADLQSAMIDISDEGFFFIDNEFYTTTYKTFLNFQKSRYESYGEDSRHRTLPYSANTNNIYFVGKDSDGNWYWRSSISAVIIIFNNEGFVLEKFKYDKMKSSVVPAVAPNGDIYFLDSSQDGHDLYRIQRQW